MNYDHNKKESWEIENPENEGFEFWMTIEGWRLGDFREAAKMAGVQIKDVVDSKGMTSVYCLPDEDMTEFWIELDKLHWREGADKKSRRGMENR